jgi:hypothetical protein
VAKNGWGASSSWDTILEAVEAAKRSRKGREVKISRSRGTWGGYRFGRGEVVATVNPDGSVRYGK